MDSINYQTIAHYLNAGENERVIQLCHGISDLSERGDICHLLGLAYLRMGQPHLAVAHFEQAIISNSNNAQINFDLGIALLRVGELHKAYSILTKCYELEPGNPAIIEKLALVLTNLGKQNQAISLLEQYLSNDSNQPGIYNCLAYAYEKNGNLAKAEASIRSAIKYSPNSPEVYNNLGNILKARGNSEQAIKSFRQALKLKPDFSGVYSNLLLCMNYVPSIRLDEIFQEHRKWAEQCKQQEFECKSTKKIRSGKKIRVGYVSPDFRSHPVVHYFLPVLKNHDRNKFEIYCYAEVARPDIFSQEVASLSDSCINTCGISNHALAKKICDDNIDILIDLAGHTENNRLDVFALKPSPVQATYLGYPNTTGLSTIDYRISDNILDPEGSQRFYSEKLVRLPKGFSCFSPPKYYPDVYSPPYQRNEVITFGSFNNPAKFNKHIFKCWAKILESVPNSRLMLFRNTLGEQEKDNLTRQFVELGLHQHQITLLNRAPKIDSNLPPGRHYLRAMTEDVDICLDTFPWSGHTTACESLWMGVPVVTLYGDRPSSRLCASVLNQLELSFLIARNEDDYIKIATELAANPERLADLRSRLRQLMSSSIACDGKQFTGTLEKAYKKMYREREQV